MKKPVNRFAVVLWVLAGFLLVADLLSYVLVPMLTLATTNDPHMRLPVIEASWMSISASLSSCAMLAAFGYIIELIDQIRFNKKNFEE